MLSSVRLYLQAGQELHSELLGENLPTSLLPFLNSGSYKKWDIPYDVALVASLTAPFYLGREVHSLVLTKSVATECICKFLCL